MGSLDAVGQAVPDTIRVVPIETVERRHVSDRGTCQAEPDLPVLNPRVRSFRSRPWAVALHPVGVSSCSRTQRGQAKRVLYGMQNAAASDRTPPR